MNSFDKQGFAQHSRLANEPDLRQVRLLTIDQQIDDQPVVILQMRQHLPHRRQPQFLSRQWLLIDHY